MQRYAISLGVLLSLATAVMAQTQTEPRSSSKATATSSHESHFYIKGPNAPFKNQLRKLTDPLNANGAGR